MKQKASSDCKEIKFCQMFYLRICNCGIETFRKCSECNDKPLCIICESSHFHKNKISDTIRKTCVSINDSDQKEMVVIQ